MRQLRSATRYTTLIETAGETVNTRLPPTLFVHLVEALFASMHPADAPVSWMVEWSWSTVSVCAAFAYVAPALPSACTWQVEVVPVPYLMSQLIATIAIGVAPEDVTAVASRREAPHCVVSGMPGGIVAPEQIGRTFVLIVTGSVPVVVARTFAVNPEPAQVIEPSRDAPPEPVRLVPPVTVTVTASAICATAIDPARTDSTTIADRLTCAIIARSSLSGPPSAPCTADPHH
jgi:hypothetical protein